MSRIALALALACSALALPDIADACGNSIRPVVDRTNEIVRKAELLLAQGQHGKAAMTLKQEFGADLLTTAPASRRLLHERAQRVLALALVRSGGDFEYVKDFGGKTESHRRQALAWSALMLRLQRTEQSEPTLSAELAEALALQPSGRPEAFALLQELAEGDLMPSARGWSLLAGLRRERGDAEGSEAAVERCKQIATDEATCELVENS